MPKKIITIGLSIIFSLLSVAAVLAVTPPAPTPVNPTGTANPTGSLGSVVTQVGSQTTLPSLDTGHASQAYEPGAAQITSIIYFILDFLKYVLGGVAVIMLIISGIKLILAGRGVADVMNREKETLRFSFLGLLIIIIADQVAKIFFGQEGEIYRTQADLQLSAGNAVKFAQGATDLLRVLIPSLAILFIVLAAYKLMTSQGDAEKLNKAKKQITWAILGIVLAGLAEVIIYQVVYPNLGTSIPDPQAFTRLVVQITNFVTGFISILAVIMIIYAGYLYVISLGGAGLEKAKTILKGAIIGLLISMAAFGIVNTVIKVEPLQGVTPAQQTPKAP